MKSVLCTIIGALIAICANAQSVRSTDSALNQISKIKDDSLRLDAMFAYNKQLWQTDPSQTLPVINTAMKEARQVKRPFFIAKSYSALGYYYLLSNDFPNALKQFLEALSLWRKLQNSEREVETLLYLADIYTKINDLEKAENTASEALALCGARQMEAFEAKAYNQLAIVYSKRGLTPKSIHTYHKGISAARKVQDKYFEAFLLGNLGYAYRTQGERGDAMRVWDPLESTCRHASLSIL